VLRAYQEISLALSCKETGFIWQSAEVRATEYVLVTNITLQSQSDATGKEDKKRERERERETEITYIMQEFFSC
jgi:hypothetical protein